MHERIALQRLENQRLSRQGPRDLADLVAWFGAVQAQDYAAAKWALALRMPDGATNARIERAFNDGRARYGRFLELPISISAAAGGGRAVRDRSRTS